MQLLKADILSGYNKFLKKSQTAKDMKGLMRGKDGKEDPKCPNHLPDAYLYAYRYIYNRHIKSFSPPPTEEDRMIMQLENRLKVKDTKAFGEEF